VVVCLGTPFFWYVTLRHGGLTLFLSTSSVRQINSLGQKLRYFEIMKTMRIGGETAV